MEAIVATIHSAFWAIALCSAMIGFIVVCRRVFDLREAERAKAAFYARNPTALHCPPAPRDFETNCFEMRGRVEAAEYEAAAAKEEAEEARLLVKRIKESAAEELALIEEETEWRRARELEFHLDELTSALAETFDEAERHWIAGLNEDERKAAWAVHWSSFEQPVAEAMEAHIRSKRPPTDGRS